jgi:TolB-like protein
LESFWVANITNFFSFPIFTFKGVSDLNDISFYKISPDQEIEYLLNPSLRRNKKKLILQKLQDIIDGLTIKFMDILRQI